jgi:hypothetical protein
MTEPKGKKGGAEINRRQLIGLLRQLLRGPCRMEEAAGGQVKVSGATERLYPQEVMTHARSAGLVRWSKGIIEASDEAAAFLRRALIEGEEPMADQHREIVETVVEVDSLRQSARRNLLESPLGAIARLKGRDGEAFLTVEAVEAGERLLADFTRGQLQPRITASWEPRLATSAKGQRGGQAEIADSALAARARFAEAVEAMGPELAGVAIDVCCFSKGLELVERERQWPSRSAKLMLRTALLALARHYAPPPRKARHGHRWGTDDYRPVMQPR